MGRPALPAERVDVTGDLRAEVRSKGIYRIPFYSAELEIKGEFPPAFGVKRSTFFLDISDKKAVEVTSFIVDGKPLVFRDRGDDPGRLVMTLPLPARKFALKLKLQGTEKLHFHPTGRFTAELKSNWPDPSFTGAYLPASREITDQGFTARWEMRSLLGSAVTLNAPPKAKGAVRGMDYADVPEEFQQSFGVNLFLPVDIYQQTTRSVKYGILFVGLTFLAFFLFEILAALRIHPLQYLLVGSALCIFYLLLLSISEQVGFLIAYLSGSAATIGLITMYSWSVLRQGRRAMLLGGLLVLLYGFLFTLLQMEQYSLMLGSLALFLILAMVMWLTRNIDWYNLPVNTGAEERTT